MVSFLPKCAPHYFLYLNIAILITFFSSLQVQASHNYNFNNNFKLPISHKTRDLHIATDSSRHEKLYETLSNSYFIPATIHAFPPNIQQENWKSLNIFETKHHNVGTVCGIVLVSAQNLDSAVKSVLFFSMDTLEQKILYKNRLQIVHLAADRSEVEAMLSIFKSVQSSMYETLKYGGIVRMMLYKYSHTFILILSQTAIIKAFYICAHCGMTLLEMDSDFQNSGIYSKYVCIEGYKVATIRVMDKVHSVPSLCDESNERISFAESVAWDVFCLKNITLKSTQNALLDPFLPTMFSEHVM